MESIDDETDALDITFVKINDPRYAKKYGVNKLPALVYFRKKFPSIYRGNVLFVAYKTLFSTGSTVIHNTPCIHISICQFFDFIISDDLLDESEVLTWLRSNRYKKVELDWIMYTVLSAALAFLLYSAFLVYGLKPNKEEKKLDDE